MQLVNIRENALTVELDWADCTLLAYLLREALSYDALHDADNWSMAHGYAQTVAALLEAGGMATWAYTVEQENFTLDEFRTVAPVTKDNRAKKQARLARYRRPAGSAPDRQPDDTAPPA